MKKIFLLSFLLVTTYAIQAQENTSKESGEQWYNVIVNGNSYWISNSVNRLKEYTPSPKKDVKIKTANRIKKIFISDNKICVAETPSERKKKITTERLIIESFDLDGNKIGDIVLFEENEEELDFWDLNKEMKKNIMYDYDARENEEVVLSTNKYLGYHYTTFRYNKNIKDKFIIFEIDNFKPVKTIDLKAETNSQCFLLDNGDLITLQGDARNHIKGAPFLGLTEPITLTKYSFNGDSKKQLEIPLNAGAEQLRSGVYYKLSEDQKLLYITMNYGKYTPPKHNINQSYKPSSGVQLSIINTEKLELIESKLTAINPTSIAEIGSEKKDAIPFLKTYDIRENGTDIFIFTQIRKPWVDSGGYIKFEYGNLLVFKESKTSDSVQKVIKVDPKDSRFPTTPFSSKSIMKKFYPEQK